MLDPKFLSQQENKLLREEKRISAELKTVKKYPELGSSQDDNAQEAESFGENTALSFSLQKELKSVREALKRIKEGRYGICSNCHGDIDKERLSVYPAAKTCLDCPKIK